MFARILLLSSVLLFGSGVFVYFRFVKVSEKDQEEYQELMQESVSLHSKNAILKEPAKEVRSRVDKDIWSEDGKSHLHLTSQSSELILSQKGHSLEAHETFFDMLGFAKNYQIEAKSGFYSFPSKELLVHQVKIFTESSFCLEADLAEIIDPDQPLQLKGNIRLTSSMHQDKETYALADEALYSPQKQLFILKGSPEKNVLCWQNGAMFAAPELHIQQDAKTIEGIGDVRFSFNTDEKNYFESIFAKYL